jgi:hypothetical protein
MPRRSSSFNHKSKCACSKCEPLLLLRDSVGESLKEFEKLLQINHQPLKESIIYELWHHCLRMKVNVAQLNEDEAVKGETLNCSDVF